MTAGDRRNDDTLDAVVLLVHLSCRPDRRDPARCLQHCCIRVLISLGRYVPLRTRGRRLRNSNRTEARSGVLSLRKVRERSLPSRIKLHYIPRRVARVHPA